jgi:hypothetical protein
MANFALLAADIAEYNMMSVSSGVLVTDVPLPTGQATGPGTGGVPILIAWINSGQSFGWSNVDRRLAIYVGNNYVMGTPVATTGASCVLASGWTLLDIAP